MMSRRGLASIVVGLVLLLAPPLVWWLATPDDQVGDLAAAGLPEPGRTFTDDDAAAEFPPASDAGEPVIADDATGDDEADVDSSDADASVGTGAASFTTTEVTGGVTPVADPARVAIPRVDIDVPVDRVGREPDGAMEIPPDVRRAGWFAPGAVRPGDDGTAVIAGHVDSRTQGRGAFFTLTSLEVGDEIEVTDTDGGATSWRVTARTSYGKAQIPLSDIFTRTGPPRLALITCGGAFDAATRSYEENVVVIAEPV